MMEAELETALYALVAAGALLFLLRFGKVVARYAIIFGALAVAGIIGLALYEHARATRQAVAVAAGASVAAVILAALLLATAGCAGYFYLRWRLAEGRHSDRGWLPGPNARWRRRVRPAERPTLYVVEDGDEDDESADIALEVLAHREEWGF